MNRRDTLTALAALAATATPLEFLAQPRQVNRPLRIGFTFGFASSPQFREAFIARMRELGWQENHSYVIVAQTVGQVDLAQIPANISFLLNQSLDALVVSSTASALEAHRLTKTLPIVMLASGYPVEAGLAHSLARPGKNVTGNSLYASTGIWGKLLDLLRESKPSIKRVGILWGYVPPAFPAAEIEPVYDEFRRGANALGLSIHIEEVPVRDRLPAALSAVASHRPDALFLPGWLTAGDGWSKVVDFTTDRKLPTISDFHGPSVQQAPKPLLVYAPQMADLWRQTTSYVDRILRGASPAELPIQLPSRFELTVNLSTAKAIGLRLPQSILLRADRVIE